MDAEDKFFGAEQMPKKQTQCWQEHPEILEVIGVVATAAAVAAAAAVLPEVEVD